jgi:hypothetical protein
MDNNKKSVVKKPIVKKVIDKPIIDEPVINKPVKKRVVKKVIDKPIIDEPVINKPVKKRVVKKVIDKPIINEPVINEPVVKKRVVKKQVAKKVISKKVIDKVVIDEPVINEPVVKKRVVKKQVTKKIIDKPIIMEHTFFNKEFTCYPTSYYAIQNDIDIDELEYCDKIVLPPSVLAHLSNFDVSNPIMLKISSQTSNNYIYCGIKEFMATDNIVYIPNWMMTHLSVDTSDKVNIISVNLPKATFIKIKPLSPLFEKLSNPRIVLEYHLQQFITLQKNNIIEIKYCNNIFKFQIIEIEPADAVNINNANVNIDIFNES